jgi:hypothetical protein
LALAALGKNCMKGTEMKKLLVVGVLGMVCMGGDAELTRSKYMVVDEAIQVGGTVFITDSSFSIKTTKDRRHDYVIMATTDGGLVVLHTIDQKAVARVVLMTPTLRNMD